jgi:hypothetical protein
MWERQTKLNYQQEFAVSNAPILYPKGFPDFPVKGLSHYVENVNAVRKSLFMKDGDNTLTEAVLVCEPDNPYSDDNSAVAVYVNNLKVGHLPDLSSRIFFDVISAVGGICRARCKFYYSEEGNSSCRLDVVFPPTFSKPSKNPELVFLKGSDAFTFRMRSSKYPINWTSLSEKESPLYLEVGDTYIGEGIFYMSQHQRSPYLQTDFRIETAKPYTADERVVNRVLASLGGEARVRFSLTRTSLTAHCTQLDLDLTKWKEAERVHNENKKKNKTIRPPSDTTAVIPKRAKSNTTKWTKALLAKPKKKKSSWTSLFFGD